LIYGNSMEIHATKKSNYCLECLGGGTWNKYLLIGKLLIRSLSTLYAMIFYGLFFLFTLIYVGAM